MRNPRDAQALGVGMVYQHFTLVPALTAAENLVVSRADAPAVIDWRKERKALDAFLDRDAVPRAARRSRSPRMAAGEKQKLEILKLLYLDQRFLILDEPTSVLTPGEADEILGLLRDMAHRGEITVADDQPQVPRGRGVLRRLHRAEARRQGRRRQGRRGVDPRHGGDDDRRRGRPPVGGARHGAAERRRDARDRRPVRRERRRARRGQRLRHQGPRRRDRRRRRRLRQRPERAGRGACPGSGRSSSVRC